MRPSSRVARLAPVVALVALALTGCSGQGLAPGAGGVAARVGDDTVSVQDVNLITDVSCSVSAQSQSSSSSVEPISLVRMQSLNSLVNSTLIQQLVKKDPATYSPTQLTAAMASVESQLSSVPKDKRTKVLGLLRTFYIGELELIDLGTRQLQAKGTNSPTQDDALNAGYAMLDKFAKTVKTSVDPQYAPGTDHQPGNGIRSLSKAVSSFAKQSDSTSPTQTWTTALPKNQQCG